MIRCWVNITRLRHNEERRERGEPLEPAIVLEEYGRERYAHRATLLGATRIVYDPAGLHNGVRVWVEAEGAEIDE